MTLYGIRPVREYQTDVSTSHWQNGNDLEPGKEVSYNTLELACAKAAEGAKAEGVSFEVFQLTPVAVFEATVTVTKKEL
jgi:hypothetical protein